MSSPWHTHLRHTTAEIYESPKDMADMRFVVENPQEGRKWWADLRAMPDFRQVGAFEGFPVYGASNYFFGEHEGRIVYFVRYEDRPFPRSKGRYVTQIAIERDPEAPRGISEYVFWNLLFPIHGAIMTDNAQTRLGKRFWENQIVVARNRGIVAYYVDLREGTARRIGGSFDFENAAREAYGGADRHRDLRLLLCVEPPAGLAISESWARGLIQCMITQQAIPPPVRPS